MIKTEEKLSRKTMKTKKTNRAKLQKALRVSANDKAIDEKWSKWTGKAFMDWVVQTYGKRKDKRRNLLIFTADNI